MASRDLWQLKSGLRYLNHGSFGACPTSVLEAQSRIRNELETQPMAFFASLERRLDDARAALGEFLGADAADLAFVGNATTGVNAVLRSLRLEPGDEILTTDHAYNACANAMRFVAERAGARVLVAHVPFPTASPEQVVASVLFSVTKRTRLVVLDHVTSPTALVLPVEELCRELAQRGVDVLIDGAHAPGMLPLDLRALADAGCTYYTGNLHKWVCAPKGSAFLYVRRDRQASVQPAVISHAYNSQRRDRSSFLQAFDWVGTYDPSPYLVVPIAITVMGRLFPGGWTELMEHNRGQVLEARTLVADALDIDPVVPRQMIGSMASLVLPPTRDSCYGPYDRLQDELLSKARIQTMIPFFPAPPRRVIRLSFAAYNDLGEFRLLAHALAERMHA